MLWLAIHCLSYNPLWFRSGRKQSEQSVSLPEKNILLCKRITSPDEDGSGCGRCHSLLGYINDWKPDVYL
jgi:hypothetical protein